MVNINRWAIYWASLDPVKGSEQAGRRPVLLVSDDSVNVLNQVTILPLSKVKSPDRTVYPNEAFLPREHSGLPDDSIVLAHQIRSLDKNRFEREAGRISDSAIQERILKAIRVQLGL
jgi:mRNA interferase MazF